MRKTHIELVVRVQDLKPLALLFVNHWRVLSVRLVSLKTAYDIAGTVVKPVNRPALEGVHKLSVS